MLTLYRPIHSLSRWSREFDKLLGWPTGNGDTASFTPAVDIEERAESFVIRADLPGMEEKDIEVKVHNRTLYLSGKREESKEEKTDTGYYQERRYGTFYRQFRLGENVDLDKVEAKYEKGVLEVVVLKKPEAQPKQIPVQAN